VQAKPKALRYADMLGAVDERIVDALPEIIDGLIARAKQGNSKAAVYLCPASRCQAWFLVSGRPDQRETSARMSSLRCLPSQKQETKSDTAKPMCRSDATLGGARAVGVCVHIGKIIRKERALRRMPHPARVT